MLYKFILCFILVSKVTCSSYCKTSSEHVLCKYPNLGPGVQCRYYDQTVELNTADIKNLEDKINERRNFIALGHSGNPLLPTAANMQKVIWNEELAKFAQRWADQCDPDTQPDKRDDCRDLEDTPVGQNIASVMGDSPGLQVKSFVDVWFMQSLYYTGTVTYYNSSINFKTDYFTQLIWAETSEIGCGRVKFLTEKNIIDRIVCNFATKGNIDGKAVYRIGVPATQCAEGTSRDRKYQGLCAKTHDEGTFVSKFPVNNYSILLRILNLHPESPSYITNTTNKDRQLPRTTPLSKEHKNIARHIENLTDDPLIEYITKKQNSPKANFNGLITPNVIYPKQHPQKNMYDKKSLDYDMHVHQCTRIHPTIVPMLESADKLCTRGLVENCFPLMYDPFIPLPSPALYEPFHHDCTCQPTYISPLPAVTTPPCSCIGHECCNHKNNPKVNHASRDNSERRSNNMVSKDLHYLELFPNLNVRSGSDPDVSSEIQRENKNFYSKHIKAENKLFTPGKYNSHRNENGIRHKLINHQNYDYDPFHLRKRKKRSFDNIFSHNPSYELKNYKYNNKIGLKSLKYTTLPSLRKKYNKQTESITVLSNLLTEPTDSHKYLSFEELLNARKQNTDDFFATGRRHLDSFRRNENKTENATKSSLVEKEEEFGFQKVKYCTRKITCTWTMANDGNSSNGQTGLSIIIGSRTPPGFVEGCTRTSTCTRVAWEKNVFFTTPTMITDLNAKENNEDDEYCEKRSLEHNEPKERIFESKITTSENDYLESYPEQSTISPATVNTPPWQFSTDKNNEAINPVTQCFCHFHNAKPKRHISNPQCCGIPDDSEKANSKTQITYHQLFKSVLNKINPWKHKKPMKKCACNGCLVTKIQKNIYFVLFLYLLLL